MKFLKKILFLRYVSRWLLMARGMHPSQMWGRVFNLDQKELVSLDGFDLYVMPNDYIGSQVIRNKSYEPHVTSLIKNTLGKEDVFLDIGANIGYFTMLASSIVKKGGGKVIAFEPNPQNLQLIYSSMQKNCAENIDIYPYAVSNTASILRFTNVGSNGGVVTKHSKDQKHFFLVQSVVLDVILKDEAKISLIKIDIEAHEPFALKGMDELIKKHQPKIITEFHPWAMRLNNLGDPSVYLDQILDLGYRLSIIKPTGELMDASCSHDVILHWESLGVETIHLDLFAQPVGA
ncbi:MAG: FkbM family methyltransferase [Candidatus Nitrotoga sp.]